MKFLEGLFHWANRCEKYLITTMDNFQIITYLFLYKKYILDTNQKNRVKKRFLHEKIVFLLKKGYFCIQNLCIFRFKE